ncbi:MAG: hypothetical protein WCP98_03670 [Actinomycetes bacterium]
MPEGNTNIEIAQHLHEHSTAQGHPAPSRRRIETLEILEAILLAVVAIATAFSGYQAARWDGESSRAYSEASALSVQSNEAQISTNEVLMYNAGAFTAWLQAYAAGDGHLQALLERRFTDEYRVAFEAWLKTDPFTDPAAPAGPGLMAEYKDPRSEEAATLAQESNAAFETGIESRETGEHYVRITVILAAVLFLIAIGQRFQIRGVRYGLSAVAGAFLLYCVVLIVIYPRA